MWMHVHSMASYQHGRHSTATNLSARAQECKKRGVTTGCKDIDPYILKLRWNALTKDNPQRTLSSSVRDQSEALQATRMIIRWYSQLNKVQLNFTDCSSLSTVKAAFVPRTGKKKSFTEELPSITATATWFHTGVEVPTRQDNYAFFGSFKL